MRSFLYALLTVVIVISTLVIVVNWKRIMEWWNTPADGSKCVFANEPAYVEGVIQNGKCVVKPGSMSENENNSGAPNSSGTPSNEYDLQVSNPKGAHMYYQSLSQASGGMIYGKSNLVLPYGTKLKLVKTWQTNLSTQPFSGYYETNYKDYGPTSGFFSTEDVMKIK